MTSKEKHRGAQFTGVPGYVQLFFSFSLFLLQSLFFLRLFFFLIFLYFSLDQQHIRRKHTKFQNFLCKDVTSGKSAKSLKSVQKLQSSDRQSSQGNFAKIESANPAKREESDVKFSVDVHGLKKIRIPSPYAKVIAV